MARFARIVIPNFPHHVIQRGNRKQPIFFQPNDYRDYLNLLSHWCRRHGVKLWAYCLMRNHVHFILVPTSEDGLRAAVGETHKRYSRQINFRCNWRGYLFQGRFSSYPLDTQHLLTATRYIERNPVEAGLVSEPDQYPWSSARAHVNGEADPYLDPSPLLDELTNWREYLDTPLQTPEISPLEQHARTGRPLGNSTFIADLERKTGRALSPKKRGPKTAETRN